MVARLQRRERTVSLFPILVNFTRLRGMTMIETDERSRVVLPGHPKEKFIVQENSDGSILLLPAVVITQAQFEYDRNPELQDLLTRAAASKTVNKARRRST